MFKDVISNKYLSEVLVLIFFNLLIFLLWAGGINTWFFIVLVVVSILRSMFSIFLLKVDPNITVNYLTVAGYVFLIFLLFII